MFTWCTTVKPETLDYGEVPIFRHTRSASAQPVVHVTATGLSREQRHSSNTLIVPTPRSPRSSSRASSFSSQSVTKALALSPRSPSLSAAVPRLPVQGLVSPRVKRRSHKASLYDATPSSVASTTWNDNSPTSGAVELPDLKAMKPPMLHSEADRDSYNLSVNRRDDSVNAGEVASNAIATSNEKVESQRINAGPVRIQAQNQTETQDRGLAEAEVRESTETQDRSSLIVPLNPIYEVSEYSESPPASAAGSPRPSLSGPVPQTEPAVPHTEPAVPHTEPAVPHTESATLHTESTVPHTEPSVRQDAEMTIIDEEASKPVNMETNEKPSFKNVPHKVPFSAKKHTAKAAIGSPKVKAKAHSPIGKSCPAMPPPQVTNDVIDENYRHITANSSDSGSGGVHHEEIDAFGNGDDELVTRPRRRSSLSPANITEGLGRRESVTVAPSGEPSQLNSPKIVFKAPKAKPKAKAALKKAPPPKAAVAADSHGGLRTRDRDKMIDQLLPQEKKDLYCACNFAREHVLTDPEEHPEVDCELRDKAFCLFVFLFALKVADSEKQHPVSTAIAHASAHAQGQLATEKAKQAAPKVRFLLTAICKPILTQLVTPDPTRSKEDMANDIYESVGVMMGDRPAGWKSRIEYVKDAVINWSWSKGLELKREQPAEFEKLWQIMVDAMDLCRKEGDSYHHAMVQVESAISNESE